MKNTYFDVRPLAPPSPWQGLNGPCWLGQASHRSGQELFFVASFFLYFVLFGVLVLLLAWTDKSLFCVRIILIRQLSGESAREDFAIVGKTPTRRGHVRAIFQVCCANFLSVNMCFFCIHI